MLFAMTTLKSSPGPADGLKLLTRWCTEYHRLYECGVKSPTTWPSIFRLIQSREYSGGYLLTLGTLAASCLLQSLLHVSQPPSELPKSNLPSLFRPGSRILSINGLEDHIHRELFIVVAAFRRFGKISLKQPIVSG